MKKAGLCLVILIFVCPALASAQNRGDLRVWIQAPRFISPDADYEPVYIYWRNKGAGAVTGAALSYTLPVETYLYSGTASPFNMGDFGVYTDVYDTSFNLGATGALLPGTTVAISAAVTYFDGVESKTATARAVIEVVQFDVSTLVGGVTWGQYSPDGGRIVYHTPYGEIYTIAPDGSANTRLTFNSTCDSKPRFNRDGTMIVWQHQNTTEYEGSIWAMNADGTNQHEVADGSDYSESVYGCFNFPVWTPQNNIIFRTCNEPYQALFLVGADGGPLQQLTPPGMLMSNNYVSDLQGRYFAARNNQDWRPPRLQIFDLLAAGGPAHVGEVGYLSESAMPSFQPGTDRLVFKDDYTGWGQLYTMRIDRAELRALTTERAENEYQLSDNAREVTVDQPMLDQVTGVWLAGDTQHAGTNYLTGGQYDNLYNVLTLGTPLSSDPNARIPVIVSYTYLPEACSAKPSFSADGKWIVYKSEIDGYMAIWAMRFDGSLKTRLTFVNDMGDGENKVLPAVRPGNTQVLYNDESDLRVINVNLDQILTMPHANR